LWNSVDFARRKVAPTRNVKFQNAVDFKRHVALINAKLEDQVNSFMINFIMIAAGYEMSAVCTNTGGVGAASWRRF